MSPFVYRLEKILKYRENKKEEQLDKVAKAKEEVGRIQNEIDKNNNTIITLKENMYNSPGMLLESYDNFIKHLRDQNIQLEEEKRLAIEVLNEEKKILEELEKSIKALEKHKEKSHEIYLEEEKQIEMRILDEVGSQKHFAKTREALEEQELEEIKQLAEINDMDDTDNFN